MGGYVKDMYRLPMYLLRWFLRNVSDLFTFRLVVPPGVSIAVPALQKRPIWSIIYCCSSFLLGQEKNEVE